ncbi:hypothetical protein L9F63_008351, partial [Diploptera punctata]
RSGTSKSGPAQRELRPRSGRLCQHPAGSPPSPHGHQPAPCSLAQRATLSPLHYRPLAAERRRIGPPRTSTSACERGDQKSWKQCIQGLPKILPNSSISIINPLICGSRTQRRGSSKETIVLSHRFEVFKVVNMTSAVTLYSHSPFLPITPFILLQTS